MHLPGLFTLSTSSFCFGSRPDAKPVEGCELGAHAEKASSFVPVLL